MRNVPTAEKVAAAATAISWIPTWAEVALDGARDATDRGHRQHACRDRAEHAADAVDGEDVERVVDAQALAQQRGAVADAARGKADQQRAARRDVPGGRSDRDQSGNRAGRGTDHADLAVVRV